MQVSVGSRMNDSGHAHQLPSPAPLGRRGSVRRASFARSTSGSGRSATPPPGNSQGGSGRRRSVPEDHSVGRTRSGILRRSLERLEGTDHVHAVVRVRPFLPSEKGDRAAVVRIDGKRAVVVDPATGREREAFIFDSCFGSHASQQADQADVFEATGRHVVENAIAGYNSCVFAYGQTCSGKTHTMVGPTPHQEDTRGIMPRAVGLLFGRIEELQRENQGIAGKDVWYEVHCLFFEIYMERVRDLTSDAHHGEASWRDLRVRNHPQTGPFVEGLTPHRVQNAQALLQLVTKGARERTTSATVSNDHSSRSHAVLEVTLRATEAYESKGHDVVSTTSSRLNLVDLAGSERLKTTPGLQYNTDETSSINLSLSTLRRVIDTLIDNTRSGRKLLPPYRESMLTWLLSESLGGNSKTVMIGTVSPNPDHIEETLNTLRYVHKAKGIVNVVRRNEDKHFALIRSLRDEVALLQRQLEARPAGNGAGAADRVPEADELREQIELRNQLIADLRARGTHSVSLVDAATQTGPAAPAPAGAAEAEGPDGAVAEGTETCAASTPARPHQPPHSIETYQEALREKHQHLADAMRLQAQQAATLEALTLEVHTLQSQLRAKNAEHIEFREARDRAVAQNVQLQHELRDIREAKADTEVAMRAVQQASSGVETQWSEYEQRLVALRESLEDKIRVVSELSEANRALRERQRAVERELRERDRPSSDGVVGDLERSARTSVLVGQLTEQRDEAQRRCNEERDLRRAADLQERELRAELDLARREQRRTRQLLDRRGLALVGSGDKTELVPLGLARDGQPAPPGERRQSPLRRAPDGRVSPSHVQRLSLSSFPSPRPTGPCGGALGSARSRTPLSRREQASPGPAGRPPSPRLQENGANGGKRPSTPSSRAASTNMARRRYSGGLGTPRLRTSTG